MNLVAAWRHSTVFTEAERAALALTEEGTRLADAAGRLRRDLGAGAASTTTTTRSSRWSPLVALINATNRLGVIPNYAGGSYEPGSSTAWPADG